MIFNRSLALFLALCLPLAQLRAQDGKKEKAPVFNYVIDDPMDAFGRQPAEEIIYYPVAFPDFYSFKPRMVKDTTFKFESYDTHNELILLDSLHDIDDVRYISLIKSYNDPVETYVDSKGVKQPLPIARIIYRYDKVGSSKWLSVDYATNKSTYLAEFTNYTSRVDTATGTNPVTGAPQKIIHKYYKVFPAKL